MTKAEKIAVRMRDLLADGYEWPDAEWEATKDYKNAPSSQEIGNAYDNLE